MSGNPPARLSVEELEERLLRVNISLSTGTNADRERVLGYVRDPESPYRLLGEACLEVMNGRRFKEREYLDMIEKRYTQIVGAGSYLTANGNDPSPGVEGRDGPGAQRLPQPDGEVGRRDRGVATDQ